MGFMLLLRRNRFWRCVLGLDGRHDLTNPGKAVLFALELPFTE